MMNTAKLTGIFHEHGDQLTNETKGDIYNLLIREVMNEKVAKDIIDSDVNGQRMS